MYKITIIIPVYNAEAYIENCVSSLLAQSFKDYEIILVNDGSVDKSAAIIEKLALKHKFITCYHKSNGGAASARNIGLEHAKGDFVSFVDADDTVSHDFLDKLYTAANEHKADMVMCDYIKHTDKNTFPYTQPIRSGVYSKEQIKEELYPCLIMFDNLEFPPTISNCVCLFKRSLLTENSILYPEVRLCEDSLFGSMALYNSNCFVYLKGQHLYNYLYYPSSASHSVSKEKIIKRWESFLTLNKLYREYFSRADYDFSVQIQYNMLYFTLNQLSAVNSLGLGFGKHRKEVLAIMKNKQVREALGKIKYPRVPFKLKLYIFLVCHRMASMYCIAHR